jgi:two-component system response regulator VicR
MLEDLETKPRRASARLSVAEIAVWCDVSTTEVNGWIESGRLQAERPPRGHYEVARSDLVDFLRRRGMPVPPHLEARPIIRVLVVDDEPMVRAVVANILEATGDMEVALAADGFEAGPLVNNVKPHVVVLDLKMPGIDGATVCRRIRSDPRSAGVRVLFLTGHVDPESLALVRASGADGYLTKPFIATDLIEAVRDLAGRQGSAISVQPCAGGVPGR